MELLNHNHVPREQSRAMLTPEAVTSRSWTYTFQAGRYEATAGMIHFGARGYSPSLERWVQQDPAAYIDGLNRYQMEQSNPVESTDPLGLWGIAGHFWTTYMMAMLTPQFANNQAGAYDLAYYTQLSDQLPYTDATSVGLAAERGDQYSRDVQNWLHSLMGGKAADLLKRRNCLRNMLMDEPLSNWERGFVLHAWEDTFAHRQANGDPYGIGRGHLLDGHSPDMISLNMQRFDEYANELYQVILNSDIANRSHLKVQDPRVQQTIDALLNDIAVVGPYGMDQDSFVAAENSIAANRGHNNFNYNYPYTPNDKHNLDPMMYVPSKDEVKDVIEKMKKACPCALGMQ